MTERNDERFDRMIAEELGAVPPSDAIVEEVNPWYAPIHNVVWGIILTQMTLQIFGLQYILPIIGVAMSYIGFRSLRNNGKAFRAAWVLSIIDILYHTAMMLVRVLPLEEGPWAAQVAVADAVLGIVQLILLRRGLRGIYAEAGVIPEGDPIRSAVIWRAICIALALWINGTVSWLFAIPFFIAFIVIVRAMFRIAEELKDAGYCFNAAPVRISGGWFGIGYLALCVIIVIGGSLAVNHPHLDAAPQAETALAAERQALVDIGVPQDAVDDLTDEHVEALRGAIYAERYSDVLSFRKFENPTSERSGNTHLLHAESVNIDLSGRRMAILARFDWGEQSVLWRDAVCIPWTDCPATLIGGSLLYDKNGETYEAALPGLRVRNTDRMDDYYGPTTSAKITGSVYYPLGAKNERGYVLYVLELPEENYFGAADMRYYHNRWPLGFVYRSPEEVTQGWTGAHLQHNYVNFWTKAARDQEKTRDYE